MTTIASQNTSLTIVYSIVYSDADQRKHQSSASLAFVRGIHRWPVNSPHKRPVTRKMFPLDDVIMYWRVLTVYKLFFALQWRHNELAGVSNHQTHDCLPNRLFTCKSKKTSNSASLAFVMGIHRRPVNSPRKGPVTRKMFPFDVVIVWYTNPHLYSHLLASAYSLQIILRTLITEMSPWRSASQITGNSIVGLTACSGWQQNKHQRSALLNIREGNPPLFPRTTSQSVMQKMSPCHDLPMAVLLKMFVKFADVSLSIFSMTWRHSGNREILNCTIPPEQIFRGNSGDDAFCFYAAVPTAHRNDSR